MCESLPVRRDKWTSRARGKLKIMRGVKAELYQMEREIAEIDDLAKAEEAKRHLTVLWKTFKSCLEPMEEA